MIFSSLLLSVPKGDLLLSYLETLFDVEAAVESGTHLLERQQRGLRVKEVNNEKEDKCEACVEAKSTGRSDGIHKAQEGRRDDEVGRPVDCGRDRGTDHARLGGEELALLPRYVAKTGGIRADVENHKDKHGRGVRRWIRITLDEALVGGLEHLCKDSGGANQENNDTGHRGEKEAATAETINVLERDESAEEVGSADDETGCDRLLEPGRLEQGARKVHEGVEA